MANYKIEKNNDPYKLDMATKDSNTVVALTKKNAEFIEAIVALDSNYKKELMIVEPSIGYDPEMMASDSKNKYCGSSKYWFNKMKNAKTEADFRTSVLGAIIAIDKYNSTHLETSLNGRKCMRDLICTYCKDANDLSNQLNKEYKKEDSNHLINKLNVAFDAVNGGKIYHFSFITKFCSYAAKFFKSKIQYPKYDKVVSANLPFYINVYLEVGNKIKKGEFSLQQKIDGDSSKKDKIAMIYESYWKNIDKILNSLPKDEKITKDEFDHIVWYTNKG